MDRAAIEEELGSEAAALIAALGWEPLPGTEQIEAIEEELASAGARLEEIGESSDGRPMRALHVGSGPRRALAWGFPHPDEPLGAAALIHLARALLAGEAPALAASWRITLVLCADPDHAALQRWLPAGEEPVSLESYLRGAWAPIRIGAEVEYGFPISWGPFFQPPDYRGRCRRRADCELLHWPAGQCPEPVWAPLAESIAIASLIDRICPEQVIAMHNEHAGGCYSFLLRHPDSSTQRLLHELPALCGAYPHLGEQLDPGELLPGSRDLIYEHDLAARSRRLKQSPGYEPGMLYAGNASAAQYVEALGTEAQFLCPEATLFTHPAFADRTPDPRGVLRLELARSAVRRRHEVMDREQEIWRRIKELPGLRWHWYEEEARQPPTREERPEEPDPDRDPTLMRAASVAEAASWEWFWPLHSAHLLGRLSNYLSFQDQQRPEIGAARRELEQLQQQLIRPLPEQLLREADRPAALRSQLARMLALLR